MTNPVSNAYFKFLTLEEEDKLLREILESTPATDFKIDDGDETYFRYWTDDDLKIRTCHECKSSEFKSPDDGVWILYCTRERLLWVCDQLDKHNYSLECSLCKNYMTSSTKRYIK